MEDGRLTDGHGRVVDFKNTVIVMTSNVGASELKKQRTVGFGALDDADKTYENMKENVLSELKKVFRPELLNRLDEIIVFRELTKEDLVDIAQLMLQEVEKRLQERGIRLESDEEAVRLLAEKGTDLAYGARPLRRAIQRMVEDALSEEILTGRIRLGGRVKMQVQDGELIFCNSEITPDILPEPAI